MAQESFSGQETIDAKTILIVEDDVSIGDLIKPAIAAETPYFCVLTMDGFQALKEVSTLKPNLFILDYNLPDMDGLELHTKLHAIKELQDIPTIMVSSKLPHSELKNMGYQVWRNHLSCVICSRQLKGLCASFS